MARHKRRRARLSGTKKAARKTGKRGKSGRKGAKWSGKKSFTLKKYGKTLKCHYWSKGLGGKPHVACTGQ